jgi:phospholipase A1
MERLACYDERERREAARSLEPDRSAATDRALGTKDVAQPSTTASVLEERWELRPELQRGIFNLVPHRPVYGLAHWTNNANENPFSPTRTFSEQVDLDPAEVKIQLSFKTKVMQDLLGTDGDLWFGYTQVSYWQIGNSRYSSPFRETNYEPEMMFVYPLQANLGGLRLRFASIGLNHQSNGRAEPLSRSWNRVIGELAAEWGAWSFHVRPWKRVFESSGDGDDNPDIEDFAGRGELAVVHRSNGHVLTLTGRHSLRSGSRSHGSARLDWAFPIVGALNGHVQLFSGYGLSLIDYNHRQTTVGFGVSFFD